MEIDVKSIREFLIVGTLLATIVGLFMNIQGWKVHIEDRMDAMEKHLEYDDQRLNKIGDEINVVERRIDWERSRRRGAVLDLDGDKAKRRSSNTASASELPASWRGPLTRQESDARSGGD